MDAKRPNVNGRSSPTAEDIARSGKQLRELHDAIRGERFWILATDNPASAFSFRSLAFTLVMYGAPEGAVVLADTDIINTKDRTRASFTCVAISKTVLTGHQVEAFAAGVMGRPLPKGESGNDIFVVAYDPERVAACIEQIRLGKCFVANPNAN